MDILIIPSLLAIAIKIGVFLRYHNSLRRENLDLGLFFLAVFFLNVFEMLSIRAEYSADTSLRILLAYYCCVVFTVHGFVNVALYCSQSTWQTGRIRVMLNVLLALMIVHLIFNRSIVEGVEPLSGYTLTRIAGDAYWIFQFYLLTGLGMAIALLLWGLLGSESNLVRQKCLVVLISSAAPVLMAVGVVALMAAGININGVVFMSLTLSLMLGLMIYAEEKTRLFRLLTIVPYTRERRLHKQLLSNITDCITINDDASQKPLNLKQMMRELEGSVVEHVLNYYDGNQKKTACALGVSEATVSRRARALSREHQENDSVAITE